MKGLHWWTLAAGLAIGYFVLPSVVAMLMNIFNGQGG